jgi:hypothetical protein
MSVFRKFILGASVLGLLALASACKGKPGESCKNPKEASCLDLKTVLVCHDKSWTKLKCEGPKGCAAAGNAVDCDESLGTVGEFCDRDGNVACAPDHKAQVRCENGVWQIDASCKGPDQCQTTSDSVKCDDSVAAVKDPCFQEAHHTCSENKDAVLVCRNKVFMVAAVCASKSCSIKGTTAGCE